MYYPIGTTEELFQVGYVKQLPCISRNLKGSQVWLISLLVLPKVALETSPLQRFGCIARKFLRLMKPCGFK